MTLAFRNCFEKSGSDHGFIYLVLDDQSFLKGGTNYSFKDDPHFVCQISEPSTNIEVSKNLKILVNIRVYDCSETLQVIKSTLNKFILRIWS